MKTIPALFLLTLLSTTTQVHAASIVQSVVADLDHDGKPDRISEINVGKEKNILRIQLSSNGKKFDFANLLPNSKFKDGSSYCSSYRPNAISVKKSPNGLEADIVTVSMGKGMFDGCETSYTVRGVELELGFSQESLQVDSLRYFAHGHGHHDCDNRKETAFRFALNSVEVSQESGYYYFIKRSHAVPMGWEGNKDCYLSLSEFNAKPEAPSCARDSARELWKTLWLPSERPNDFYDCGLEEDQKF